ncbi:hypothetical protein KKA14_16620, partial [bacterium]|nr:hypothetical protein [bacterium]
NFSTNFYMRDVSETATAIEGSQFGAHIIQYQQEKGVITVLTDDWIWDNDSIHCYDHAYLLWLLTQGNKKIWFLYKTDSPSFIELLIKNNHILVLSSLLLLFLFVLKHSQRFGPIIETTHFQRRHLKEHIDASGMYYWRHNQGQNLLTGLRKEIKRKMALYHPEVLDLPKAQMLNYLSEINTISVKEIDQALHHDGSAQINWTLFSTRLTGISSLKLFSAKKTRKIPHKVLIKEKEFSDMVKTLQHIMENL